MNYDNGSNLSPADIVALAGTNGNGNNGGWGFGNDGW